MLKPADIDLPVVSTEEEIEEVRQMMTSKEIWRNLARMEQPKKGKFFLLFQIIFELLFQKNLKFCLNHYRRNFDYHFQSLLVQMIYHQ